MAFIWTKLKSMKETFLLEFVKDMVNSQTLCTNTSASFIMTYTPARASYCLEKTSTSANSSRVYGTESAKTKANSITMASGSTTKQMEMGLSNSKADK